MATADAHGLFWNSNEGDRKYDADSFEKWLKKFFTSGVFEGDLQVTASSGMTVNVGTGYCNLFGKVGLFESVNAVTLAPANSTYPRIDTVVIERHDTDREIYIKAVTGAYSGNNPQPTARVWNEVTGVYQLILAQIYVAAGVASISQLDITDKRTDTTVCGYISGTVQEMDFSQFAAQFESYYEQFVASNQEDFEAWFDEMKDQLTTDAAGHLQAEVDATNGNIGTLANLTTTDKTSLVGAINEVDAHADANANAIGVLANLTTTDKTSLVGAINEVDAHADSAQASADNAQQMIAIIENGDVCTHTGGISQWQYVCWKGALYTADSAISVGATFASSGGSKNLTAVTDGGLNNVRIEGSTNYCKLPDGTLICWGSTNISVSANSRATKLVETETFISNPIVTATIQTYGISSDGTTKISINVSGITTTRITILAGNTASTSTNFDVDYIAIGRWK